MGKTKVVLLYAFKKAEPDKSGLRFILLGDRNPRGLFGEVTKSNDGMTRPTFVFLKSDLKVVGTIEVPAR